MILVGNICGNYVGLGGITAEFIKGEDGRLWLNYNGDYLMRLSKIEKFLSIEDYFVYCLFTNYLR